MPIDVDEPDESARFGYPWLNKVRLAARNTLHPYSNGSTVTLTVQRIPISPSNSAANLSKRTRSFLRKGLITSRLHLKGLLK